MCQKVIIIYIYYFYYIPCLLLEKVLPLNCSAPSIIQHGGVYVYTLPTRVKVSMIITIIILIMYIDTTHIGTFIIYIHIYIRLLNAWTLA